MPSIGIDPNVARTRARVAVATRRGDSNALTDARREHAESLLAAYITKVVAKAPPLTEEQRHRIAALLTAAGGGRG